MKCLEDFIKFRAFCKGSDDEPSTSGLYYENLDALSVVNVSDITGEKFQNHLDLVKFKTAFAAERVISLALSLQPTFRWREAVKFYEGGVFTNNYLPASSGISGISIYRHDNTSTYTQIEAVKILADFTGQKDLLVIRGNILNPISTTVYPVDLIAQNVFRLDLNIRVDEPEVHIGWEQDISVNQSYLYTTHNSFGCICGDTYNCEYASIGGFKDGVKSNQTAGIAVEFSVRCDKQRFFCRIADILKYAVLYMAGAEILKEAKFSGRENFFTLYKDIDIQSTIRDYEKTMNQELEITMDQIRDYIRSIHCPCFDCKGNQIGINIP